MEQINYNHAYQLKKLELEAMLEVTQAINSNLPEEQLFRIFYFTLRANLNIQKFALFVCDAAGWECKVHHSPNINIKSLQLNDEIVRKIDKLESTESLPEEFRREFRQVFPIKHKEQTLAYMFMDSERPELLGGDTDMKFVRALTNIIIVAIENKKLARQQLEQKAIQRELEIAKDVQRFLFPKSLPKTDELQVEAKYLPHHQVGGDYYDYIEIDANKFLVCVADVSGKGVPAAILMANFQASLRTLARKTVDLREIVHELNHQVMQNASGENFITAFLGLFDREKGVLQYVNSGHNPPYLIRKDKKSISTLEKGSTILGILDKLPFLNMGEETDLNDFQLFCFTDGLTETFNPQEEVWGPEELLEYLENHYQLPLDQLHEGIFNEIETFRQDEPHHDDITMLSCAYRKI